VLVDHAEWGCRWKLQYPECIASDRTWFMDCQPFKVDWICNGASLLYTWRMDAAYLDARARERSADPDGAFAHKRYEPGLSVHAVITPHEDHVGLQLALGNETDAALQGVECDGGCFQALSKAFAGPRERARSFLRIGGRPVSLAGLSQTVPERGLYVADPGMYETPPYDEGEWFWGRSDARPDVPATAGMVSKDGQRAVAVVFEDAYACSANADSHHCLHSRPRFGTLAPGETVVRHGAIHFGPGIETVFRMAHPR
jgi:hypothetical protein